MGSTNSVSVQFQPIETGDLSDIPPDLPAGEWTAKCTVTKKVTSKDKYPMLSLAWKTSACADDENENFVGKKVFDNLIFFPKGHGGERMQKQKLKELCLALEIEIPTVTKLSSWDDIADLIDAIDNASATVYTFHETDKLTGQVNTRVRYTAPGASYGMPATPAKDDDEDAPPAKKAAAKNAKRR